MSRRLALFATGEVGLAVAGVLARSATDVRCLVLDDRDLDGFNDPIAAALPGVEHRLGADGCPDEHVSSALRAAEIDLGILAWWPKLLRGPLLGAPRLGHLNLHPSLLPHARGKDPNFWSIVQELPYGVSIHWVDEGVDTGDIAFQAPIDIRWSDTGLTLYERAKQAIVDLFEASLPCILDGEIPRCPQPAGSDAGHTRGQLHAASRIDLDGAYRGRELINLLRAKTYAPHSGAWFEVDGRRYEIQVTITEIEAD